MLRKPRSVLVVFLVCSMISSACSTFNIQSKPLVDGTLPNNISSLLYYCSDFGPSKLVSTVFVSEKRKTYKIESDYIPGCFNAIPSDAIAKFSDLLHYNNQQDLIDELGQPYLYKNYKDFEVMLFEGSMGSSGDYYHLVFQKSGIVKKIELLHPQGKSADGVCKDGENLFVFYREAPNDYTRPIMVYKVETENNYNIVSYSINIQDIGLSEIILYVDSPKVYNDVLYFVGESESKADYFNGAPNQSYIVKYDLNSGESKLSKNENSVAFNIYDTGKNLITINRHMGDLFYDKLSVNYYDYNLNLISSEYIPLNKYLNTFHSYETYYYFYNNGMIMGAVGSGGDEDRKKNYLFIYDLNQKQITYLNKITANNDQQNLRDNVFLHMDNSELFHFDD